MRRKIVGASFLAAAVLVTSFFVSPAAARPSPGHRRRGGVRRARAVQHAAATRREPASWRVRDPHHLLENQPSAPKRARQPGGTDFRVVVPTYFHVITNGSLGAVSDDTIKRQMIALDLSYRGFYGGVDTGFRFVLSGVTRTNNAAWFNMGAESSAEDAAKRALRRGGPNALNVYTTAGGGFLGWAYYPDIVLSATQYHLDGVVVDFQSLPGGAYGTQYSLGFTLSHEAGHWFEPGPHVRRRLLRAWRQRGRHSGTGDHRPSGCPIGRDSCPSDPGPIRSTTTWTTRTTLVTRSSARARRRACRTRGCHWRGMSRFLSRGAREWRETAQIAVRICRNSGNSTEGEL